MHRLNRFLFITVIVTLICVHIWFINTKFSNTFEQSNSLRVYSGSVDNEEKVRKIQDGRRNSMNFSREDASWSRWIDKCEMYSYIRFWKRHLTSKDYFISPLRQLRYSFKQTPDQFKYVVFKHGKGGWNNVRMNAETIIVFAIVTGRILVSPPVSKYYLLNKHHLKEDINSTFESFFDVDKITDLVDIISMEEFLSHVAVNGYLRENLTAFQVKRLLNSTDELWNYLERACHVREWEPGRHFIGFNFTELNGESVYKSSNRLQLQNELIILNNVNENYSVGSRLQKFASHDRRVMSYNQSFHDEIAIFFPGDRRRTHRLLTHFYSYLYFADQKMDRYYKRMVRDRLHYHDWIFCLAGQAVRMLHELSAQEYPYINAPQASNKDPITLGGNTNYDSTYFAFHIRRGDFQYKFTRLDPSFLWDNSKHLLDSNRSRVIYISSDEKNRTLFDSFQYDFKNDTLVKYKLVYFDDLVDKIALLSGYSRISKNYIGMIEQIICANAHTFIGTPLSTFTGYITRMRGYYRDNRYIRTYYTMKEYQHQLHITRDLIGPFWAREFSIAHQNIDDDNV